MIRRKESYISANVNPGNNNTFVSKPYTEYQARPTKGELKSIQKIQKAYAEKKTTENKKKALTEATNRSQELYNKEREYINKKVLKRK